MKNFLLFFSIISLMFEKALSKSRLCKPKLLRSLGFHSLVNPTRVNSLCPNIPLNCCTNYD